MLYLTDLQLGHHSDVMQAETLNDGKRMDWAVQEKIADATLPMKNVQEVLRRGQLAVRES